MMKSPITKKYQRLTRIYTVLSLLFTLGPLIVYLVIAFIMANSTTSKLIISMACTCALVVGVGTFFISRDIGVVPWIILVGVSFILHDVTLLVIIIAIGTFFDVVLWTPLKKRYQSKYTISRELDERLGDGTEQ